MVRLACVSRPTNQPGGWVSRCTSFEGLPQTTRRSRHNRNSTATRCPRWARALVDSNTTLSSSKRETGPLANAHMRIAGHCGKRVFWFGDAFAGKSTVFLKGGDERDSVRCRTSSGSLSTGSAVSRMGQTFVSSGSGRGDASAIPSRLGRSFHLGVAAYPRTSIEPRYYVASRLPAVGPLRSLFQFPFSDDADP